MMPSRCVFSRSADVVHSVAFALLVLAATRVAGDPPAGECDSPATPIHAIQGPGRSSPLLRAATESVVVEAIVVGAFPGYPGGLGGFFLQEEDTDADDDPRTSEGIFVFHRLSTTALEAGDRVRIRGHVREFFGLTELTRVSDVVVCPSRGRASPVMIRLPVADEADWERWEGMLVRLEQPLAVSGHRNLDLFGELELAAGGHGM
jgi:predicted extracellular nuclease